MIHEIRVLNTNTLIGELNSLDLKQSEFLQKKYLKTNWAGTLSKNSGYFRDAINTQKELLQDNSKLKSTYENIFIIVLQSIALIIVLLTQIQALRMLEFQRFQRFETIETTKTRAEILLGKIENYIKINNTTQLKIAREMGVSSSDISKLRNRVVGKGEALSDRKLIDLNEKLIEIKY